MHITIDRIPLLSALSAAQGVVERKPSNPALSQVLIETTPGGIRITATDTTTTLISERPCAVTEPGAVAVDAAQLFASLKALSGSVVTLRTASLHTPYDQRLSVASGPAEHNLLIGAVDDYPPTPVVKDRATLTLPGPVLARLISEVVPAISTDDKRYGLNGVHAEEVVDPDGANRLRFVSTDGSRLNYSEAPYEGRFGVGRKMLIPRKLLSEARKLIDAAPWSLSFGERTAILSCEGTTLIGRLIEGEFPEYRQVLPASFKRKVVVESKRLSEALKTVRVMANDRNHLVRFSFEADRLVLTVQSADAGDARCEVAIELWGSPLLTGFNLTFFQDILTAANPERLTLELGEALDPCIVRADDRDDCLFVVMPMRLE